MNHSNPALDRRRGIFTSSPIYLKKMKTKGVYDEIIK